MFSFVTEDYFVSEESWHWCEMCSCWNFVKQKFPVFELDLSVVRVYLIKHLVLSNVKTSQFSDN